MIAAPNPRNDLPWYGQERTIKLRLGGRVEPRGKVTRIQGALAYYRDLPASQILRFVAPAGGLGIDTALLDHLERHGVTSVVYHVQGRGVLRATTNAFREHGLHRPMNGRDQYFLALGRWAAMPPPTLAWIPAGREEVVDGD
jgi:hypothetical protein